MGGQRHTPTTLPPKKSRCPCYRRLSEPQNRSGRVRKISPPPGFDPRTLQPVASHYTDWAIPAPWCCYYTLNLEVSLHFQRSKALNEKESLLYVRCTNLSQYMHTCFICFLNQSVCALTCCELCLICLLFREKSSIHVHMFFCILTMFTVLARNGCTSGRYYPTMQSIETNWTRDFFFMLVWVNGNLERMEHIVVVHEQPSHIIAEIWRGELFTLKRV